MKQKQPSAILYIGEVLKCWKIKKRKKHFHSRCSLTKYNLNISEAPSAVLIHGNNILTCPMANETQSYKAPWTYYTFIF